MPQDSAVVHASPEATRVLLSPHKRGLAVAMLVAGVVGTWSSTARAQETAPTVEGSVTGTLRVNSQVVLRIQATAGEGPRAIRQLKIGLLLHDVVLQEIVFDPEKETVGLAEGVAVQIGTPGIVSGEFFRFSGMDVDTSIDGVEMRLVVHASIVNEIPPGTVYRFTAVDDDLRKVQVTRRANLPEALAKPFPWGSVALIAAAALFAGGFVGNLFASHRRPVAAAPSVYDAIRRRMSQQAAEP